MVQFGRFLVHLGSLQPSKSLKNHWFFKVFAISGNLAKYGHLMPTWGQLAPTWPNLVPTWTQLGTILGLSWLKLGPLGVSWGPSWANLAPRSSQDGPKIQKKLDPKINEILDRFLIDVWSIFVDFGSQLGSQEGGAGAHFSTTVWLLGPSWGQDGPKTSQNGAKMAPRPPNLEPHTGPCSSGGSLGSSDSVGTSASSSGLGTCGAEPGMMMHDDDA